MKTVSRIVVAVLGLLMAACGTVATPVFSEQAQGTREALAVTVEHLTEIAPTATFTPLPTSTPTDVPTATSVPPTPTTEPPTAVPATATPAPVAQAEPSGDPVKGKEYFETMRTEVNFACATCHYVDKEDQLIGPGLLNVSVRAETRVAGETAYEYIHNSIVNPSAFVVPNFPDGLMPQVYKDLWTEEQINDIIAYLFTLKSQ
ncbi:MAG: c-type cytochrome [Anaerolineae bacterium]